jgi:hypothetical protein
VLSAIIGWDCQRGSQAPDALLDLGILEGHRVEAFGSAFMTASGERGFHSTNRQT